MKRYLTILSFFFLQITQAQTPTANAGADQTIYLTVTNQVTLNGSASTGTGLSYVWREVSSDYSSGATITSPTSVSTTVTGLPQGVFYFELQVTDNVDRVAVDTVKITVNYTTAPANSTLLFNFPLSDATVLSIVNNRSDTTTYFPPSNSLGQVTDGNGHKWYLFRDRLNGLRIDAQRGKLISTIEDGYAGETSDGTTYYSRAEIALADGDFLIDTSKIYAFEWKGYLPSDTNLINTNGAPDWAEILTMFQIHSLSQTPTVFGMNEGVKGNIYAGFQTDSLTLGYIPDFTHSRTLRFTIKEGNGAGAFMKVELDGQTVYYLKNTQIGSGYYDDYVKFGGLYDWRNWITNPDSLARGRKYSLVTEGFNVYQLSDTVTNVAPTAHAGSDQTITLPTSTVTLTGSGTDTDGTIASYSWSKISGSTYTISNSTVSNPTISNLLQGTYVFRLTVTDNQGATGTDDVQVTVNPAAGISNYIISSGGQKVMINQ
ncbi:MAG TPA: PKD domain-containing protein [Hanamia sp.]|nr:PKD domain-containing protein [Hanamia sp.]